MIMKMSWPPTWTLTKFQGSNDQHCWLVENPPNFSMTDILSSVSSVSLGKACHLWVLIILTFSNLRLNVSSMSFNLISRSPGPLCWQEGQLVPREYSVTAPNQDPPNQDLQGIIKPFSIQSLEGKMKLMYQEAIALTGREQNMPLVKFTHLLMCACASL